MKYRFRIQFIFTALIFFYGCSSQKKLSYFQGNIPVFPEDSVYRTKIFPGDILAISVFTINAEAFPFLSSSSEKPVSDTRSAYEKGYVVNEAGDVKLPLAGVVNLNGLSTPQAVKVIEEKFKVYIEDPVITVKKLNFKVTVLGEVNRPGTYTILNEQVTLPELLGMAGDLSQFSDRKNIRIIRSENNVRGDFTVDLTNSSSFTASTWYLHPDDIIYIQPVKRRAFQNISPTVTVFTSILTTAVVLMTFIITASK
jgi:polysaccharide biosynthesis/export protein